jgi:hypothetical protein
VESLRLIHNKTSVARVFPRAKENLKNHNMSNQTNSPSTQKTMKSNTNNFVVVSTQREHQDVSPKAGIQREQCAE